MLSSLDPSAHAGVNSPRYPDCTTRPGRWGGLCAGQRTPEHAMDPLIRPHDRQVPVHKAHVEDTLNSPRAGARGVRVRFAPPTRTRWDESQILVSQANSREPGPRPSFEHDAGSPVVALSQPLAALRAWSAPPPDRGWWHWVVGSIPPAGCCCRPTRGGSSAPGGPSVRPCGAGRWSTRGCATSPRRVPTVHRWRSHLGASHHPSLVRMWSITAVCSACGLNITSSASCSTRTLCPGGQ